jgi:4-amino-4-deoxy-L-arabinose transferase-like glycosyltransferase
MAGKRLDDDGAPAHRLHLNKVGPTIVLLSIILLGFALRLYRLGNQNIWWDEGHAIWTARQDIRTVTSITAHDVHPPLYLWMLHAWIKFAGDTEFAIRYLSLIGGMLTVSLTYVVARRLIGRRAAMLATLLIATARFHIWWSQEARMYIWATFFALLSVYFFTRLRQDRGVSWWSYIAASAAALYTLYLSVLVLVLENVFVASTVWHKPQRRRFLYRWGLSQCGILLLYGPWLYLALSFSRTDIGQGKFPLHQVWQLYGTVLVTGVSTNLNRYLALLLAFFGLAGAGIALFVLDRTQPQRYGMMGWEIGLLLALPLLIPPTVVFALSIPRGAFYAPKPEARYLLLLAPLFYVLLAGTLAGFWQRQRWGRTVTATGTLLVFGTFVTVLPGYYAGRYMRDEYQTTMKTIAVYGQPDDAILVVSGDRYPLFMYYYERQFAQQEGPTVYLMPRQNTVFTSENVDAELSPLASRHERLWLASFERSLQDPENLVQPWLDNHREMLLHVSQSYNYVRLYATEQTLPTIDVTTIDLPNRFAPAPVMSDQTQILGYDLLTDEFRPGDTVRPGVYVQAPENTELAVDWIHDNGTLVERQMLHVPAVDSEQLAVRLMPAFAVYTHTQPGPYSIRLHQPDGGTESIDLFAGRITQSRALPKYRMRTAEQHTLDQGQIEFLGYTIQPQAQVRAGRQLTIDLFWQANTSLDRDYTVFVHLLGPYNPKTGGPVWAQDDSFPALDGHPTSRWHAGQIVPDRHVIHIAPDTPAGFYQIEVGLYDASTGNRLPIDDEDTDRILIESIEVGDPPRR